MQATQSPISRLEVIYKKVEADSQFSLDYLRAVDAVINVATDVRNNAEIAEKACKHILAHLAESGGYDKPLDPKGTLMPKSASAETIVRKTILALQALDGSMLPAEHAEEVFVSYEDAIGALQQLHDAMVDLRWAVLEHDADLEEPKGKAFDNVEDLFADLRSR